MKEKIEAQIKEYQKILNNSIRAQLAAEGAILALQKLIKEEPKEG